MTSTELPLINLVITDLDDTIWDWLEMWYKSFNPYLTEIQEMSKAEMNKLKEDFKNLHRKYGTSEVSYAFNELKSLNRSQKKKIIEEKNGISILHNYYKNKKENVKLYPGVHKVLMDLKKRGVKIIGFTESNSFYTKYRIKTLKLDGVFDIIYTPKEHEIPTGVKRYYPKGYWESVLTRYEVLPRTIKKPDPTILLKIIRDVGGNIENTVYIGDKLDRDVYMANLAGVVSVYAKYGHIIDNQAYGLLREVTHWSEEDVLREIEFKEKFQLINEELKMPNNTVSRFEEILELFHFEKFPKEVLDNNEIVNKIDMWKKTIDVQQHFNDLELRIRNFAITLIGAILGLTALAIEKTMFIKVFDINISLSFFLALLAGGIWLAFYLMDRYWYHQLLYGAVKHGELIENKMNLRYPEIDLTHTISSESHGKSIFGIQLNTRIKMDIFYNIVGIILLILSVFFFFGIRNGMDSSKNLSVNEHMVLATLYEEFSGEYMALQYQAYNTAKDKIKDYISSTKLSGKEAVILDIDETVLKTSPYQAKLIIENKFFPDGYKDYLSKSICLPVPGALDFLYFIDSLGINIFYVSNREMEHKEALVNNLLKYKFPQVNSERILLNDNSSSKEKRRELINRNYKVILLVGDNLNDFSDLFNLKSNYDVMKMVTKNNQSFGNRYIILPNCSYGDWESNIYNRNWKLTPEERDIKRKEIIKHIYKSTF